MHPLVSCICVTRDRRSFIGAAIKAYLAQDWPEKELVVIDDGKYPVGDLCSQVPNCNYIYLPAAEKIGPKRNLACEKARGQIIAHWDDDDWSAPERIRKQVISLWDTQKSVTGYHSLLFWESAGNRGFKYKGFPHYSLGSALCYRAEFRSRHHFIAEGQGQYEDNVFVQHARAEQQIASFDGGKLMVARIHDGNTSPKKPEVSPGQWPTVPSQEFPEEFFQAIA